MDHLVSSYEKDFFWICDQFLPEDFLIPILNLARDLEAKDKLSKAAIGKGHTKKIDTSIRSDKILWIDGYDALEVQYLTGIFDSLRAVFREKFFLPVKRHEFHFAKYDKGSFYKLHQDTHAEKPGRLVSCVLYLSTSPEGEGGELVLYDEDLRPVKVRPEKGKLVVFDSAIEHEVKKTNVERWSVTGWLRSDIHPGVRL